MTTLFREHPPAQPVTGFTIERYINFPADQKRSGMPGPIAPPHCIHNRSGGMSAAGESRHTSTEQGVCF
jgi:hypothetical protein